MHFLHEFNAGPTSIDLLSISLHDWHFFRKVLLPTLKLQPGRKTVFGLCERRAKNRVLSGRLGLERTIPLRFCHVMSFNLNENEKGYCTKFMINTGSMSERAIDDLYHKNKSRTV